ncbi:NUDIX domain-containing protein [Georgenia sp. Z1344]|uniref:NUDIX domain-containing protein n=1 Tax=Georgenia sp. Z1344 TaxID=3416706 RepID=UPI003CEE165F
MRMPGDGWVECACGARHWGLNGAAGLLAWRPVSGHDDGATPGATAVEDASRAVDAAGPTDAAGVELALQHRAAWSHHGGTWGIPGGAIADGETALTGAMREAAEESGIEERHLRVLATRVLTHPDWSYTTVVARAAPSARVAATDAESLEVRWVGAPELRSGDLPLLPAFADSLDELAGMLGRVVLVVDSANVVGSVPDGWWRDRRAATVRLRDSLTDLAANGLPADAVGLPGTRWFPEIHLVTEGAARGVGSTADVTVHEAPGEGDDEIVRVAAALAANSPAPPEPGFVRVVVATADRALAERCRAVGAVVVGPSLVRRSQSRPRA